MDVVNGLSVGMTGVEPQEAQATSQLEPQLSGL